MASGSGTGASQQLIMNNDNRISIFQVPSYVVESYGGRRMPSKVTLKVDDSGKKWKVSVEKLKWKVSVEKLKERYFFTDGWKEFAEQVGPTSFQFLTNWPGENKRKGIGNVKATTSILRKVKREGSGDVHGNKVKTSCARTAVIFSKEVREPQRYRLVIPKGFILSTTMPNGGKVRLKDSEGREWPVGVRKVVRDGYLVMYRGWSDFLKGNKVMIGSTVSFTWLSEHTLQAEISGAGVGSQPLYGKSSKVGNLSM